jgi:hypothetical protein
MDVEMLKDPGKGAAPLLRALQITGSGRSTLSASHAANGQDSLLQSRSASADFQYAFVIAALPPSSCDEACSGLLIEGST